MTTHRSLTVAQRELVRLVGAGEYAMHRHTWYWRDLPVVGRTGPAETHSARGRGLRKLVAAGIITAPAYDAGRWGDPLPVPPAARQARGAGRPPRYALYRFRDRAGALLYIGKTLDPSGRFARHAADQPWWDEVIAIAIEDVPAAELGLREIAAIRAERPRYNVQHNPASQFTFDL